MHSSTQHNKFSRRQPSFLTRPLVYSTIGIFPASAYYIAVILITSQPNYAAAMASKSDDEASDSRSSSDSQPPAHMASDRDDEEAKAMVSSFMSDSSDLSLLSRTPSRSDEIHADEILARYTRRDENDRTVAVLSSFLKFLPSEGKNVLVHFIINHPDNSVLFVLCKRLQTAILSPSQLSQSLILTLFANKLLTFSYLQ